MRVGSSTSISFAYILIVSTVALRQVTCTALKPAQHDAAGGREAPSVSRSADLFITKMFDTPSTAYLLLRQVCCSSLPVHTISGHGVCTELFVPSYRTVF